MSYLTFVVVFREIVYCQCNVQGKHVYCVTVTASIYLSIISLSCLLLEYCIQCNTKVDHETSFLLGVRVAMPSLWAHLNK